MNRETGATAQPIIAIIEDDFPVRNAVAFAFQSHGLSVRSYARAEDVLSDSSIEEIACFIIDDRLPKLSGLDLLRELRRRDIRVPAIIITTAPSVDVRKGAADAHAVIVEKPLLGDALFREVSSALGIAADSD